MSTLNGVLIIDKPLRMSSMAAVSNVRLRAAGGDRTRARGIKVGHAGTLDPLATGVLVVAIGNATKLIDRLMATDKRYRTEIDLSAFTTTDDLEGERAEVAAQPPDQQQIQHALRAFTGMIKQRPPSFSAMKIGGRRAYELARAGRPIELPARDVWVHAIELVAYRWPVVELDIRSAKGFYVRSLARDLGSALGTGGHCRLIRRTAVGPFSIDHAVQLEALPSRLEAGDLMAPEAALALVNGSECARCGDS